MHTMVKCITGNGAINIIGLTPEEAHQIKISLLHFSKKNLPNTTREERSFNEEMVNKISHAQSELCSNPIKQGICM